jgi:hypothetical protein
MMEWTIAEKGAVLIPFERVVFVNLENQKGDVSVDFELMVRLLNNRRPEIPVWVRTNSIKGGFLSQTGGSGTARHGYLSVEAGAIVRIYSNSNL